MADHRAKRPRLSPRKPPGGQDLGAEDALMAELLAGIDASAFDMPPSSQSPVKSQPRSAPKPMPRSAQTSKPTPKPVPSTMENRRTRSPVKGPAHMPRRGASPTMPHGPKPYARPAAKPTKGKEEPSSLEALLGLKVGRVKAEREPLAPLASNVERKPVSVNKPPQPKVAPSPKPAIKPEPVPSPSTHKPLTPLQSTTSIAVQPPLSPRAPEAEDEYDADWDLDALAGLDEKVFDEPVVSAQPHSHSPPPPIPPASRPRSPANTGRSTPSQTQPYRPHRPDTRLHRGSDVRSRAFTRASSPTSPRTSTTRALGGASPSL